MLKMIEERTISGKIAKRVLEIMIDSGREPEEIVKSEGLIQISDKRELAGVIDGVLKDNPKAVSDFQRGKSEALSFLVGQIMAKTKGRANPKKVNEILKKKLGREGCLDEI
jgi:aspartyl-tRNA(Asn)/glutamyl-tRNA(Gln) amidotransferase subunit B